MARRSRKGDGAAIVALIVIGVPIWLISELVNSVGWVTPVLVIVGIVAIVIWSNHSKKVKRREYLLGKYGDESVVERIIEGYFWEGQSGEQLRDSLGSPVAIDTKTLKSKVREVWKYNRQGANRFGLRITVENGFVVGWDKKS